MDNNIAVACFPNALLHLLSTTSLQNSSMARKIMWVGDGATQMSCIKPPDAMATSEPRILESSLSQCLKPVVG